VATDENGHGTHVSGTIAAVQNNIGIVGVAPAAKILPVRVLNASGSGYLTDISDGLHYAADQGARVINMSLGGKASGIDAISIQQFYDAITYARNKGAIVVVSAGNDSGDIANSVPARFDNVIAVGALRHAYDIYRGSGPLSRANFSNFGEELDFMAPGVDILSLAISSTKPSGGSLFQDQGAYYAGLDGTSMAAPHVSGLVALLLAQDPMQSFDDIYRRLQYSSTDLGTPGFDNYYGYGSVNAYAAITHKYDSQGRVTTLYNTKDTRTDYTYWGNQKRCKPP
jgi:subtilisin family serine protease